jgi:hypothetical protein
MQANFSSKFFISFYVRPSDEDYEKSLHTLCNILKNDTQSAIFSIDSNVKNRLWGSKLIKHLMQRDYPGKKLSPGPPLRVCKLYGCTLDFLRGAALLEKITKKIFFFWFFNFFLLLNESESFSSLWFMG